MWIADATLKWSPHGNATRRALELQGEYLQREEERQPRLRYAGLALAGDYAQRHSRAGIFRACNDSVPRWRAGARYDALDADTPRIALVDERHAVAGGLSRAARRVARAASRSCSTGARASSRACALQYAWDEARAGDVRDRQLFLQYLYSIGAHGAHKF